MRKLILLLFLLSTVTLTFSQQFYGGVLGGFNATQIEGDIASGYNKLGYLAGTWIETEISDNMIWGMELKVTEKGSRKRPNIKIGDTRKYVYRLRYIELPVLLGYRYQDWAYFFAGGSFGYLFDRIGIDNYGFDPYIEYDGTRSYEIAALAGIKVDFSRLSNMTIAERLTLDVRFQYSVIPIKYYGYASRYFNTGQFNNVISTALYYRLGQ